MYQATDIQFARRTSSGIRDCLESPRCLFLRAGPEPGGSLPAQYSGPCWIGTQDRDWLWALKGRYIAAMSLRSIAQGSWL